LSHLFLGFSDVKHWWIVYFAPSAAAFATPTLRKYFHLIQNTTTSTEPTCNLLTARIAAIGPTTNSFLEEELHLHVDVVAQKPTPEALFFSVDNCHQRIL
jgi:uroporphyrinogen-III synthase